MATLRAFWNGQLPLPRAFWEYALLYGTLLNVVATGAALAAFYAHWHAAIGLALFLLPVPYLCVAVVGVWRSARTYEGPPALAQAAQIAVLLWAGLMLLL